MVQGAENDLIDVRYYTVETPVYYSRDNEPFEDLNTNTLTVDTKAILARDTAIQAQADLAAHIGQGGDATFLKELPHGNVTSGPFLAGETVTGSISLATGVVQKVETASVRVGNILGGPFQSLDTITGTTSGASAPLTSGPIDVPQHYGAVSALSGFLPASDKAKLDQIQKGAQLNILAPIDAIELISRKSTTLHSHLPVTPTSDGFMSAADKIKLNTVSPGAGVNKLSLANATTLTDGSNADSLHTHNFIGTTETFTQAVHAVTDHTSLPGVGGFPGFVGKTYEKSVAQTNNGVTIFTKDYAFEGVTALYVVSAGLASIEEFGWWGLREAFKINDVSISGTNGIVTFEIDKGSGAGNTEMFVWQGGYGI